MNIEATHAGQRTTVGLLPAAPQRKRYRSAGWLDVLTGLSRSDNPNFARMLKQSAYPVQKAYRQLMETYGGEPLFVECRSTTRQQWAFVADEIGVPGEFRVQYFDEDGFTGHLVYKTVEEAVESMLLERYRIVEPGALDRIAATARWARGVKVATLRQQAQEDLISFTEMLDAIQALE